VRLAPMRWQANIPIWNKSIALPVSRRANEFRPPDQPQIANVSPFGAFGRILTYGHW